MIDFFCFSKLRICPVVVVYSLLQLSACSLIDSHSPQQNTTLNENDHLQIEAPATKVADRFQQKTSAPGEKSSVSHSPIYCSDSGEYPGK
ncbi:MAG: hypothetical protein ACPG57_03000, partial [Porticoccaceae bacterium]